MIQMMKNQKKEKHSFAISNNILTASNNHQITQWCSKFNKISMQTLEARLMEINLYWKMRIILMIELILLMVLVGEEV